MDTNVSESDDSTASGPDPSPETSPGGPAGEDGRKRKRRRRRGKKPGTEGTHPAAAGDSAPAAAPASLSATVASLSAGLFSHLDDREEPCRVDGCHRTFTWTAQEQIQSFGQPPPRRMCAEHAAQLERFADREVACANPGCTRTWTFTKAAQIAAAQQRGNAEPAKRACDECIREEKQLSDREVRCRIDACKRTWTWTRDAQRAHRTWMRRHGDDPEPAPRDSGEGGKRRRRRKGKRRGSIHEPPPRLCDPCKAKLVQVQEREGPCKVHGCTRMALVEKEQQLRAWAALQTEDLDAETPLARRMCESCREFCRAHPDREVPCGRPGCDKTWTYKTGAQLQANLAGRHEDPIRLCPDCSSGDFVRDPSLPPGTEVMPCVVPLCEGTWHWRHGMQLAPASLGDLPIDRMCASCRAERGVVDTKDAFGNADEAGEARASEASQATVNELAPSSVPEDRDHDHAHDHARDRENDHDRSHPHTPRGSSTDAREREPRESEDSLTVDADV